MSQSVVKRSMSQPDCVFYSLGPLHFLCSFWGVNICCEFSHWATLVHDLIEAFFSHHLQIVNETYNGIAHHDAKVAS